MISLLNMLVNPHQSLLSIFRIIFYHVYLYTNICHQLLHQFFVYLLRYCLNHQKTTHQCTHQCHRIYLLSHQYRHHPQYPVNNLLSIQLVLRFHNNLCYLICTQLRILLLYRCKRFTITHFSLKKL